MRDLHGSEKAIHRLSMEMLHGSFSWILDHLPYIPGLVPPTVTGIFHVLTRCVGVWFAYLAVEGFRIPKAGSGIWRACLFGPGSWRWATLSIIRSARPWGLHLSNNIFLTLALGVLMLNILVGSNPATQWGVRPRLRRGVDTPSFRRNPCLGSQSFLRRRYPDSSLSSHHLFVPGTDGPAQCTLFCAVRCAVSSGFCPLPHSAGDLQMLAFNSDFLFITVLPVLSHYDGTRGPNTKGSKYFFYVFYPLHLWVIGILALWLT